MRPALILLASILVLSTQAKTVRAQAITDSMTIHCNADFSTYRTAQVYNSRNQQIDYDSTFFNDPRLFPTIHANVFEMYELVVDRNRKDTIVVEQQIEVFGKTVWMPKLLRDPATGTKSFQYIVRDSAANIYNTTDTIRFGKVIVEDVFSGAAPTRVRRVGTAKSPHRLKVIQHRRENLL